MERSFAMHFLLRKARGEKENGTVFLRITVDGTAAEMSTKLKWQQDRWCNKTHKAIGNREDSRTLNHHLDDMRLRVHEARRRLLEEGAEITAGAVRESLRRNAGGKTVLEAFGEFLKKKERLVGNGCSARTCQRYAATMSLVAQFMRSALKRDDVPVSRLTAGFVEELQIWLRTERKNCRNTTAKDLSNFRSAMASSIRKAPLKKDPFGELDMRRDPVKKVPLDQSELERMEKADPKSKRLCLIRDAFLFACYTGLSYVDVESLTYGDISMDRGGTVWVLLQRAKTGTDVRVPLLPQALRIMAAYRPKDTPRPSDRVLPVPSNQNVNAGLKALAKACGIQKKVAFHMGRHTFATTVTLSNGVPLNTVSKMLGHRSIRQTEHYAELDTGAIVADMERLEKRIAKKDGKKPL